MSIFTTKQQTFDAAFVKTHGSTKCKTFVTAYKAAEPTTNIPTEWTSDESPEQQAHKTAFVPPYKGTKFSPFRSAHPCADSPACCKTHFAAVWSSHKTAVFLAESPAFAATV